VKWKSGGPGCREEAVTILENFINKGVDYNIVLSFKLGERLLELRQYEPSLNAFKFGLSNVESLY
jgi:hypothetical protein